MPTPASGTISIQQINAEFGRGNNLNAYRGTTWFTPQGGSGTFSTGAISMSEFYNKQPNSPTFSFSFAGGENINLRTAAINAGWNGVSQLVATNTGTITSNSTGSYALTIDGSFPGGVQFTNNGLIVGRGGAGGVGTRMSGTVSSIIAAQPGGSAGPALFVSTPVTIQNNATIAGGGGGGGGGQGWASRGAGASGSSGGGGIGNGPGGAAATPVSGNFTTGNAGGAGTTTTAGNGGASTVNNAQTGGAGGNGGGYGSAGSIGGAGAGTAAYGGRGSGGAGGAAIVGNGNISWTAFGNRIGSIS